MIIQLEKGVAAEKKAAVVALVKELDYVIQPVRTAQSDYLVCIGKKEIDIRKVGAMPGVLDVHRVSETYKLVSRKWKQQTSRISIGDGVIVGGDQPVIMAGPCSIESEEQVTSVVGHLRKTGIKIMRGGVFKPRSSPYAFQGMGLEGLKMFHCICRENGIAIITEVMEIGQIEQMHDYVDAFQVGARNTQNFNLLKALGGTDKPVLLKCGISGTIDELLQSAEYIFSSGNEQIMLCERGIRSFETASRNTFDINAIPILKAKSHLPVIADPSHGIGIRSHVGAIALASLIAGADGVIYEVHEKPEEAASDGQQTLDFNESEMLNKRVNTLLRAMQDF